MEPMYIAKILLLGSLLQLIAPECQFPEKLRGEWVSSDRGDWTFINDTFVKGIEVDVPSIVTTDFFCIDQIGSTYLLQATVFFNIFGKTTRFFACWTIMEISDDIFKYYSETDYDRFLNDYIYGVTDETPTLNDVCNRRSNSTEHPLFNIIVRKANLENDQTTGTCPAELRHVFNDVTFLQAGLDCDNNTMDGYTSIRKLIFASSMEYNNCSHLIWSGEYLCIHHVEFEEWNHLFVLNKGSLNGSNFTCIAYRKHGSRVLATVTPRFCSANLTETDHNYYRRNVNDSIEIIFAGAVHTGKKVHCNRNK